MPTWSSRTTPLSIAALPHSLPRNEDDALRTLAEVLSIPPPKVRGGGQELLTTMAGVILYRHFPAAERSDVLARIQAVEDLQLRGRLLTCVTDVIVNPRWGIWSWTNEELKRSIEANSFISSLASDLGLSVGAIGLGELALAMYRQRKALGMIPHALVARGIISAILVLLVKWHDYELRELAAEFDRRKILKSGIYQ